MIIAVVVVVTAVVVAVLSAFFLCLFLVLFFSFSHARHKGYTRWLLLKDVLAGQD